MIDSVFPLLPYRGLDQSLLLPVLLGVLVLSMLTELFGIAFVGVVVPGYLAAVAVAQPAAALGMVLEGIVTYLIARAFSDALRRTDVWTVFFGRERFYFIVLVSVFVRQATQNWIFPQTQDVVLHYFGLEAWAEGGITSIGLVLVPLLANMFWKPGLLRGLWHVSLSCGITYVLVAWLFLPYTNLSFSSLELTIESVAVDFMFSGKAYIVMLCATLIAAQVNLRYGWDFGGILVPGLLAVVWLDPIKVVTTTTEALVLAGLTAATMRLPVLRTLNFGGPRKLTLLFIIGFFLKCAIGWSLGDSYPGMKATDLFGFGYLLPALLGVKILDKGVVVRVVAPAILVSWLGFIVGSVVGFGLQALLPYEREPVRLPADTDVAQGRLLPDRPYAFVSEAVADARAFSSGRSSKRAVRGPDAARLAQALDAPQVVDVDELVAARDVAQNLGLSPRLLDDAAPLSGPVVVYEPAAAARKNSTFSLLVRPHVQGPWLLLTHPRSDAWIAPAALWLCEALDCRGIAIAGIDEGEGEPRPSDLRSFGAALRSPTVVLRVASAEDVTAPVVHVRGRLPGALELSDLSAQSPDYRWDPPPQWGGWVDQAADVVLVLPQRDVVDHWATVARADDGEGRADVWAVATWDERGAPHYMARVRDRSLLGAQHELERFVEMAIDGREPALFAAAAVLHGAGWHTQRFADCDDQGPCWIVDMRASLNMFLLVREGRAQPLAVFVPGAGTEIGALSLGIDTLRVEQAQLLVWADVAREPAARPVLDAVHRAVDRRLRNAEDPLILHIRGLADHRAMTDAILWATSRPIVEERQVPPRLVDLQYSTGAIGDVLRSAEPIDGSARFAGLLSVQTQSLFSRNVGGTDTMAVWLGSQIRRKWLRTGVAGARRLASRGGITLIEAMPEDIALEQMGPAGFGGADEAGIDFFGAVRRLVVSRNVRHTRRLLALVETSPDLELVFGWDPLRGRRWTLAGERSADGHRRIILLETDEDCDRTTITTADPDARRALARAVFHGCRETEIVWNTEAQDDGT